MPPRQFRRVLVPLSLLGVLALLLLVAAPAEAHHGRDFLLAQTAELPHAGQLFLISSQDFVEADGGELELEPAVLFGLTDAVTLEVHGHLGREEGGDFEYESTAPAVHFLLTPPHSRWGVALSAEYEISHLDDEDSEHDEEGHDEHGDEHEGFLFRPHTAEPEEAHHGGADRAEVRLALSRVGEGSLFAVNVFAGEEQEAGSQVEWGYAAGWRRTLRPGVAWGLEAQGDLEDESGHEALVGVYLDPAGRWTVNLGAGVGLGDEGPDSTVRTSLVFRGR